MWSFRSVDRLHHVSADLVKSNLEPIFTEIASLPIPISSLPIRSEFPSVVFLSDTALAVSPGTGSLYIISTSLPGVPFTGKITAEYNLPPSRVGEDLAGSSQGTTLSSTPSPFLLQASRHLTDNVHRLLLSRLAGNHEAKKASEIGFELLEVEVDSSVVAEGIPLVPRWTLLGEDLPVWTTWYNSGWLVASSSTYTAERTNVREDVSSEMITTEKHPTVASYSWTQTSSSLTLTIPLPVGLQAADIECTLSPTSLKLSVPSTAELQPSQAKFLASSTKKWWDNIKEDESTWTWQASDGKLEIELTKVHDGIRWPSVFSRSGDDDDDETMSDSSSVHESFTPEQMEAIRANLSQFHTDGESIPESALPGLLKEEMDDDDDEGGGVFGDRQDSAVKVGREISVGSIVDGEPKWSKQSAWLLSLPLATGKSQSPSLIIKAGVDGALFEPGTLTTKPWTHLSTSPALSFVLSSKRSTRTVVHCTSAASPTATVLAFEAGDATASANVFAFFPPSRVNAVDAQQGVVRVGGGERGSLLGVKAIDVDGSTIVVALCEKALVLLPRLV